MKKKYIKPRINKIAIDKNISIVMMTDDYNPPDSPPFANIKIKDNSREDSFKA